MKLETHDDLERAAREGEALWGRGDTLGALGRYIEIMIARLDWSRRHGDAEHMRAADMVMVERLADLAVLHGQASAADDLLAGMTALLAGAGNSYGQAYALLKRLHIAVVCGDLRGGFKLLRGMRTQIGDIDTISFTPAGMDTWEARCCWEGTDDADRTVLFSRLYLGMGAILAGLGQYGDARAALERGLLHSDARAPDLAQRAMPALRLSLAATLIERGDLTEAEECLLGLEAAFDERREPGLIARRIELEGRLALLRGDLGTALGRLQEVHDLCRRHGLERAVLYASLNLAHALVLVNQTSTAASIVSDAARRAEALGDTPAAQRALAIYRLARARSHSLGGALPIAAAVSDLRESPHQASQPDAPATDEPPPLDLPQSAEFLSFFEDRALGFHWLLGQRRFDDAATLLARIAKVFGPSDSTIVQARLHLLAGLLAYYHDEYEAASDELEAAVSACRAIGLGGDLWQALRVLGWCWSSLGRPAAEREALAAETSAQLERMTASLDGAARTIFQLNKWTADEEYIASELNALARMRREAAAAPWGLRALRRWSVTRRLARLIEHIDHYKDRRARTTVGEDEPDARHAQPTLLRRLFTHPRDRLTISFLVLPDRVLVTRMGWLRLDFGISPLTRLQVRDLVGRWHRAVGAAEAGRGLFVEEEEEPVAETPHPDGREQIAERLASALQIPQMLGDLPERVCRLTFVPDDSLYGFPFAALSLGQSLLIERYALSLAFEHTPRRQSASGRPSRAVLVGIARGGPRFPALPGVRRELEQVGAVFAQSGLSVHTIVDDEASREAVSEALVRASLAHVAAHGVFASDRPDHSGIVLNPAADEPVVLSLRDLAGLHLGELRHITLAACWSADHFVLPGRWVIGLPETLWRSGARSILSSLWEVGDQLSIAFMERFYSYAARYPHDIALQRTQLDCRSGQLRGQVALGDSDSRHWACFTIYGDMI